MTPAGDATPTVSQDVPPGPEPPAAAEKPPSLGRNRAFNLLWTSQALSDLGSSMSQLAMPLLTLALTGSPIQAGLVGTAAAVTRLICQLPAGVVSDRWDRRRVMLTADAVRLVAYGLLGLVIVIDRITIWWIIAVAVVAAVFTVTHENAQFGAVRNVVPLEQVADATARNEARGAAMSLVGPPLGGALFSVARSLPFFADALSYLLSFIGVSLIRQKMQQERTEPKAHPVTELIEGVRFTLGQPFLRAVLLIAPLLNLAINGLIFAVIVILQQQGTPPVLIGTVETFIAVGALIGALLAPMVARRIPVRLLVIGIAWIGTLLIAVAATLTGSILIGVPIALTILLGPATNAALFGYQAAITPDRLQGRVVSVIFMAAMSLASISSLLGGAFVHWWGGPAAVLAFAGLLAVAAVIATMSKGIREMRPTARASTVDA